MTQSKRGRRNRRPPLEAEVRLDDWGPKGGTMTNIEQRQVVVDRGIPGELVQASIERNRKPWRGIVTSVLEPSSNRIVPPCPYYEAGCGGCQWQHLEYGAQLQVKQRLADEVMAAAGVSARVGALHRLAEPWRYRRTAAIALGWEAGFRPRGRRGIIEIRDCPIAHPLIGALAAVLNDLLRAERIPNYHGKVWLDCTVIGSDEEPGVQVLIQGIEGLTLDNHPELPDVAAVLAALPEVRSVAFRHRSGEAQPLIGPLLGQIEVAGRPMQLPAGSFFQTNLELLPGVITRMRDELLAAQAQRVADVYGGVGTFALALAGNVEQMILIELDVQAVEAARRTAAEWGISNLSFVGQHAERALVDLPAIDAVIVDPPRSGLGESVVRMIGTHRVPTVLYLSCSPPSLARDLAALQKFGYSVHSLELFDFYPQTYHVEAFAVLHL